MPDLPILHNRDILTALLNVPEMKLLDSALLDLRIPSLFEGITEAKLSRWIRKRGDRVERDEPILEIETHLVDSEIPSPAAGKLFEILVFEGNTVKVDDGCGSHRSGWFKQVHMNVT